jgi:ABC-2 type transport system permease protein
VALALSFFFYYGFDLLASFFTSGQAIQYMESIGINSHYKSMSRGVIDSRDLIYFVSVSLVFILATVKKLKN